jgi:hypothetical protein
MEGYSDSSIISSMINVNTTFYFEDEKPTIVKKQFSSSIVMDTIRQSIMEQYKYTFGEKIDPNILEQLVYGFVLFNLHKNKYMLNSKIELLKYVKDRNISHEEKEYFLHIFLYNQRPKFLTFDDHENLRSCGEIERIN